MAEADSEAVADELEGGEAEAVEVERPEELQIPEKVAQAFLRGELAIIAGAGVGVDAAFPFTFEQDVRAELGIDPAAEIAFPDVMTAYERANGRTALMERIKQRYDYVKSFAELKEAATRFHRELASAFTVNAVYTTDWDDLFERECGAIPFAAERDWAYWRIAGRKVFKIHGSINSPSSVIATDADYRQCYAKLDNSIVWEKLETMLKPQTIVFIGYGFHDTDFNAMCGAFGHRMQQLIENCYVVTQDDSEPSNIAAAMQILRTDPITFIRKLKELYPEGDYIPDERFDAMADLKEDVRVERQHMLDEGDMNEDGELLLAASYQDGLVHACEHIEANRARGQYSFRGYTDDKVAMYGQLRAAKVEAKEFEDIAYIDGYVNGLTFLTADDAGREETPLYRVFGHEGPLSTLEQFREAADQAPSLDAEAHEHGARLAAKLPPGAEYRHSTFLF